MAFGFLTVMGGVWSEGTLNPDDYSRTMIQVYKRMIHCGFAENSPVLKELESLCIRSLNNDPSLSEENYRWTQEEMEELINQVCNEHGCSFGGHPDDPACIGIWE